MVPLGGLGLLDCGLRLLGARGGLLAMWMVGFGGMVAAVAVSVESVLGVCRYRCGVRGDGGSVGGGPGKFFLDPGSDLLGFYAFAQASS